MNTVSVVAAATTTSTSSYDHEKGAQTLQVCGHSRTWSPPNDSTPCSFVRHRACLWLPGCTTLRGKKKCHARTHTYLTMMRCFPAPCEVSGRFVLWDEEGPKR